MKRYFNVFLFVSLLFLLLSLYRAEYLKIPHIQSYRRLILSMVLLCCGFLLESVCWRKTLRFHGAAVSLRSGIVSTGLSIFGKYIPGKVWLIMGRSGSIAKLEGLEEKKALYSSFVSQLLSLWTGLMTGIVCLFSITVPSHLIGLMLLLYVLLTLFLFVRPVHFFLLKLPASILKKKVTLPILQQGVVIRLVPVFLCRWVVISLSFYFLVTALTDHPFPLVAGFAFPFAGTIGLAAVFAPGGIGIREGVMTVLLLSAGFPVTLSTTISVTSRLWYLAGEFFIFTVALVLRGGVSGRRKKTVQGNS